MCPSRTAAPSLALRLLSHASHPRHPRRATPCARHRHRAARSSCIKSWRKMARHFKLNVVCVADGGWLGERSAWRHAACRVGVLVLGYAMRKDFGARVRSRSRSSHIQKKSRILA
eukprot:scaffold9170_cov112-Isochrysis_galbana.AAC.1